MKAQFRKCSAWRVRFNPLACTAYLLLAIAVFHLAALAPACASKLKQDEVLLFYPTLGHRIDAGAVWELEIHAHVYEPEEREAALALFRAGLALKTELSPAEKAIFTERARSFLVDNERGKEITIRVGGHTYPVGKTAPNGHIIGHVQIPAATVEKLRSATDTSAKLDFYAVTSPRDSRVWKGMVYLLEETGTSVISDIDDTIKITGVTDRHQLLANTFLRPFMPVAGMAAVYQKWAQAGAAFHYVSASPWQLYAPLEDFRHTQGFPAGTFHLKDFRWTDQSFFNLFESPEKYKLAVIEPLLQRFPRRRFILVGDSGEKDPEIYGDLARRYPDQIDRIFIRDATGEAADAKRYRKAFEGLSADRWKVFHNPQEIEHW